MGGGPQTHTRGTRTPSPPPTQSSGFPAEVPRVLLGAAHRGPSSFAHSDVPPLPGPRVPALAPERGQVSRELRCRIWPGLSSALAASQDSPSGWEGGSFSYCKNRRRGIARGFSLPWRLRVSQPPRLAQGFLASDLGLWLHFDAAVSAAGCGPCGSVCLPTPASQWCLGTEKVGALNSQNKTQICCSRFRSARP